MRTLLLPSSEHEATTNADGRANRQMRKNKLTSATVADMSDSIIRQVERTPSLYQD